MALTTQQQEQAWIEFIDKFMQQTTVPWSSTDLQAAISATDTWITNNQSSYVTALTAAAANFANNSTANQKLALFIFVLIQRLNMNL